MASNRNLSPERIDKYIGRTKPIINLMQNCDLPPPVKLFSSPEEKFHSSINKVYNNWRGHDDEKLIRAYKDISENNDKLEILKALGLSQTRAREAERKLRVISKEKEMLTNVLVDESLRLFAHHQWVRLLELQVVKLQREQQVENKESYYYGESDCAEKSEGWEEGGKSRSWCAAIAFCFAIAGVGFAIGCRCFF